MNVPRKYGLVRAIAVLLKVVAVIVLILGILVGELRLAGEFDEGH